MLPLIFTLCAWIILHYRAFPAIIVKAASGALLVDILGLIITAWKILLTRRTADKLRPVTGAAVDGGGKASVTNRTVAADQ